jgi:membrane protease YdiL (CAAX protease family)
MTLGWLAAAGANAYLLLGVPLTAAFQRWVGGRPLHTLWVREAPRFHLGRAGVALAVALAVAPAYALVRALGAERPDPVVVGWLVCAVAGAVAGGFAFREFRPATLRALLDCLATAGMIGAALMAAAWLARGAGAAPGVRVGVESLLLYLPVGFVLEEVFFRGAIDAYVHRPGEGRGWMSAAFVSILWALWHLPVVPRPGAAAVAGLLVVHTAVGVPLSVYWRRSGNLAVPAAAHAFIDAVRNALLG